MPPDHLVRYDVYDATGRHLVAGGTAVVDFLSHVAMFPVVGMTGGAAYYVRVGLAFDASVTVPVTIGTSLAKAGSDQPAVQMQFNAAAYQRWELEPDGTGSLTSGPNPTQPTRLATEVFWMGSAGTAHFEARLAGVASHGVLAIYRISQQGENQQVLDLVDYSNSLTMSGGALVLDAYLPAGPYLALVTRSETGGSASVQLSAALPAYPAESIVLDPSSGGSPAGPTRAAGRWPCGSRWRGRRARSRAWRRARGA
jgi:hypothetical protein